MLADRRYQRSLKYCIARVRRTGQYMSNSSFALLFSFQMRRNAKPLCTDTTLLSSDSIRPGTLTLVVVQDLLHREKAACHMLLHAATWQFSKVRDNRIFELKMTSHACLRTRTSAEPR